MQFFRIVSFTVLVSIVYGVVHDQVTIRVSREYFTLGHPPLIESSSVTLLAAVWGVMATWWVGLPLGFLIAAAATNGRRLPPVGLRSLLPHYAVLLSAMSVAAGAAGVLGYFGLGAPPVAEEIASRLSTPEQARFSAAWAAHRASYFCALFFGVSLAAVVWWQRRRRGRTGEDGRPMTARDLK